MEITIKMNSREIGEAMTNGLLAGLANLEVSAAEKGAAKDTAVAAPAPQPAPPQAVPTSIPVSQMQPQPVPTSGLPTEPPQQVPDQQQAVPVQETTYTQEELALAATQLMDAGKQQAVIDLLGSFGAQALTQLPKEQYGAFAMGLKDLGARI